MRNIVQACILGAWLFASVAAFAGVDPAVRVEAQTSGSLPMSIFSTPGGTGHSFTQAFIFFGGGTGDASISLQVFDNTTDQPIAGYPAEDIWLSGTGGGLANCAGGANPDHDTDVDGLTAWTLPLNAGGRIDPDEGDHVVIVVNGDAHEGAIGHLRFNSADIDGDGRVNLTDAGFFSFDLGGTTYRSDFNWDGVVNVSDAGMMAAALGAICP